MVSKNKLMLIFVVVALLLPFLAALVTFYTDWLFFVETGFAAVFTTTLAAKIGAGLFFGALLFIFALGNLLAANKPEFRSGGFSVAGGNVYRLQRNK
jgi:hypothetical protein